MNQLTAVTATTREMLTLSSSKNKKHCVLNFYIYVYILTLTQTYTNTAKCPSVLPSIH